MALKSSQDTAPTQPVALPAVGWSFLGQEGRAQGKGGLPSTVPLSVEKDAKEELLCSRETDKDLHGPRS